MSKTTVIAKNRIDGVPGFPSIAAGTVFECPEVCYGQLVAADAISDYEHQEVKVAKAAGGKPAKPAKGGKPEGGDGDDAGGLDD